MRRLTTLLFALGLALGTAACREEPVGPKPIPVEDTEFNPDLGVDLEEMTKTESGLYYLDLEVGEGDTAIAGRTVTTHYTGWLADGTKFDSSYDRDEPIEFTLGVGRVIPGWDEGLQGMQVGGKRQLVIPYYLAYGGRSNGKIPAYSNLVFEVELIAVQTPLEQ